MKWQELIKIGKNQKNKKQRGGKMFLKLSWIFIPGLFLSVLLISSPEEAPPGMVSVKGGTFRMGTDKRDSKEKPDNLSNYYLEEYPVHPVTLKSFYIGKYEVTQAEWKTVMVNNPSLYKGDNLPVDRVTWYDAVEYCNKRSEKEGLTPCYSGKGDDITCDFNADGYRLPTEAEWEYACRGGLKSRNYTYSGSNNVKEVAWYGLNSDGKTHPVGQKKPNELGIYDMNGNAWEWCWDWFDGNYYRTSPRDNPKGPVTGKTRIYRGGGAGGHYFWMTTTGRYTYPPAYHHWFIGFRIVKNTSGPPLPGMILVQSGTFNMGSNERGAGEKPAHQVTVRNFYMGKFEVTQEDWLTVMGYNPALTPGAKNPIHSISWYDAVEYCNKRSQKEGLTPCYSGKGNDITCDFNADGYRLPTEAEWEYACRGGMHSRNYKYSGSNNIDEVAWYSKNSGYKSHPVGQKKPNELGIYDMSGNVWEWCWDWYIVDYYKNSPAINPTGPSSGDHRAQRGGCFFPYPTDDHHWCTFRFYDEPHREFSVNGFRVVRTVK
jgi:formylglycine-generating enzyme required for sulfatase activity